MMLWVIVLVALVKYGSPAAPWWNNAVYYRILVDSFKDSNGDGLGDIAGATKQLSYVRAVGADAVILSSVSAKSKDCSSPGVMDFTEIDERYGTVDQFDAFIQKAKKIETKVLITLHPKTVSAESNWLKFSADRKNGYEDAVVWKDGTKDDVPQLEEGVDAWVWNEQRAGFWASSENETLLNLCSDNVIADLSLSQCSWLKRGASGVVLTPDYARQFECGVKLVQKMAAEALRCVGSTGSDTPIILVESSLPADMAAKYYGENGVGASSAINNALTGPTRAASPDLALALHATLLYTPQDMSPAWLTSTREGSRTMSRLGAEMVDSINLLGLTLPGSLIIQQGDELGAADTILDWVSSTKCWPARITASSSPFPWDDTPNAGFSTVEPWLPLAPNYRYANAKTEYANDLSHIGAVKVGAAMRKSPAIGPHVEITRLGDALAVLKWGGAGSILYVSNFGKSSSEANLSKIPGLPAEMTTAVSSSGSSFSPGSHVNPEKGLKLGPGETVLLAGAPRHCGGPGPVDKIAAKLSEGWQKINKYFSNM